MVKKLSMSTKVYAEWVQFNNQIQVWTKIIILELDYYPRNTPTLLKYYSPPTQRLFHYIESLILRPSVITNPEEEKNHE